MLHNLVKSRLLFVSCTIFIWMLIFTVPLIGEYYRKSNVRDDGRVEKNEDDVEKKEDDFTTSSSVINPVDIIGEDRIDFIHAGEFHQNLMCLDTMDGKIGSALGIFKCHGSGRNQFWFIMKQSHSLKNAETCAEGPADLKSKSQIFLKACNGEENQAWAYENKQLKLSGSNLCIEANLVKKHVLLNNCDENNDAQKWTKKVPPGF